MSVLSDDILDVRPESPAQPSLIRVLHVHSGNLFGGIESDLITQAVIESQLPSLRSEYALCFNGRLSAKLNSLPSVVHDLGAVRASRPASILRARRRLRQILVAGFFDFACFHSPWSLALFGRTAEHSGVGSLFWVHGELKPWHWLELWAKGARPQFAICNSHFTASSLATVFPNLDHVVIYNPVMPIPTSRRAAIRQHTRETLKTSCDDVVIIQVSRMEELKGHRMLLSALSALKQIPGWTCWIVGGAQRKSEMEYQVNLQRTAHAMGLADRVRFLGERYDVPDLLLASDICCQPNAGPEAFGLVFVEAMYAAIPVVTTKIGASLEVVDERCGRLVPKGDLNALVRALKELICDSALRMQLGRYGFKRASLLCNPVDRVREVESALRKRLSNGA